MLEWEDTVELQPRWSLLNISGYIATTLPASHPTIADIMQTFLATNNPDNVQILGFLLPSTF